MIIKSIVNFSIYAYVASFFFSSLYEISYSYYFAVSFVFFKIVQIIQNKEKLLINNKVIFFILLVYVWTVSLEIFLHSGQFNSTYNTIGKNILIFYLIFMEMKQKPKLVHNSLLILCISSLFISLCLTFNFYVEIQANGRRTLNGLNHNDLSWLLAGGLIYLFFLFSLLGKISSWNDQKFVSAVFIIASCIIIQNSIFLVGSRVVLLYLLVIILVLLIFFSLKKKILFKI